MILGKGERVKLTDAAVRAYGIQGTLVVIEDQKPQRAVVRVWRRAGAPVWVLPASLLEKAT